MPKKRPRWGVDLRGAPLGAGPPFPPSPQLDGCRPPPLANPRRSSARHLSLNLPRPPLPDFLAVRGPRCPPFALPLPRSRIVVPPHFVPCTRHRLHIDCSVLNVSCSRRQRSIDPILKRQSLPTLNAGRRPRFGCRKSSRDGPSGSPTVPLPSAPDCFRSSPFSKPPHFHRLAIDSKLDWLSSKRSAVTRSGKDRAPQPTLAKS
jgi:hypothetical protein